MASRLSKLTLSFALSVAVGARAQNDPAQDPDWTKPFPPFRIIGNLYWVGSYDLSTYLITAPQGNILAGSAFPGAPANAAHQGFGLINSTSIPMRQIQFGLKYSF